MPGTPVEIANALHEAIALGSWQQYHGPHVEALEAELAAWFGVPRALTCASGTLAVEVALRAVGVGPGDEVILAAYEYESNFLTVHALGAKPVLVDVAPGNWNLRPDCVAEALGPKTKAILVSHLHGGVVPVDEVAKIAGSVPIIEDAAQCPGAMIGSQYCGGIGLIGTLSFGGSKLLAAGRGGAILFNDERAYQRAKLWLHRGIQAWAPISELQAAVLRPQLARLKADTAARRDAVRPIATAKVAGLALFENRPDCSAAYYKVGFRYDPDKFGLPRELFVRALRAEGIAFDIGFRALHRGRSPSRFRAVGSLSEATRASEYCVKLHHPVLLCGNARLEIVARTLENIYRNANEIAAAFPPS